MPVVSFFTISIKIFWFYLLNSSHLFISINTSANFSYSHHWDEHSLSFYFTISFSLHHCQVDSRRSWSVFLFSWYWPHRSNLLVLNWLYHKSRIYLPKKTGAAEQPLKREIARWKRISVDRSETVFTCFQQSHKLKLIWSRTTDSVSLEWLRFCWTCCDQPGDAKRHALRLGTCNSLACIGSNFFF